MYKEPRFSSDGRYLYFLAFTDPLSGNYSLRKLDISSGSISDISLELINEILQSGVINSFDISPITEDIVLSSCRHKAPGGCLMVLADNSGNPLQTLIDQRGGSLFGSVNWSPDGEEIAFTLSDELGTGHWRI
jgi:Tol biopolymer transport system component